MTEATATCRRQLELEIPGPEVEKTAERVAKDLARVARVPGFRPGKAPVSLIRRRFAEDIKGEVLEKLVPEYLEKAVGEQKLSMVTRPQLDQVDWIEGGGVKFRASFEVLPDFELGDYKSLSVELPAMDLGDADVDRALEEMRERAAKYAPVEGRALQDGDYAVLQLTGVPSDGGAPIHAENVMCHIGSQETVEAFTENLRGAKPGEERKFEAVYPAEFPDARLKGKTVAYTANVLGVKEKKLPALDDAFAKDVSQAGSLEELRKQLREEMEKARERRRTELAKDKILEALLARHEFPVPEALVEEQMDSRLRNLVRALAAQGTDPRGVNVDWAGLRARQRTPAVNDVKAEILLDRIADAEKIETSEEELEQELAHAAEHSGESAQALRARLTKEGTLDRMKSKLRSAKTLEWLFRTARIETAAKQG
ncbi:MAG TPA: trigger factor [Candidatus Binatia bacterium]|nr:trigger factor [Candidatus Binatia bacterium]